MKILTKGNYYGTKDLEVSPNINNASQDSYFQSIDTLFDQPLTNILSIKLQYFLDYNHIPKSKNL